MSGPLQVSTLNGVKVYNCTASKSLPEWQKEAKQSSRRLKYNQEYRNRLELIQDFEFPTAANRIKVSPDGRFIAASGVYKPQLRMFETSQLSLKFERHSDAEVVQFQFLTDDFSKLALMRNDRTLELHAQYGLHAKIVIPKFGRDILYHKPTCDLYVAASGNDVYRLNLEQGSFMAPIETELESSNVLANNPQHPLIAIGGNQGIIECWDPRDRTKASSLNLLTSVTASNASLARAFRNSETGYGVHSIRFDDSGLLMGVGTASGHLLLYDIRASAPLSTKDHRYGLPVHSIKFHESSQKIITADSKIMRIWDKTSGMLHTSIQPQCDINDVALYKDSGLIFAACETPKIQIYYVPTLGSVPNWCAHLEGLTEELEEQHSTAVYDDYKFVTKEQLESWGAEHLIGSSMLRAYMHGFFINSRLYESLSVSTSEDYQSFLKKQVDKTIEEKRNNRISVKSKLPNVNKDLAHDILVNQISNNKSKKSEGNILGDSRFSSLFEDEDFQIDKTSEEFKRINAGSSATLKKDVVKVDSVIKAVEKHDTQDLIDENAKIFMETTGKIQSSFTPKKTGLSAAGFSDDDMSGEEQQSDFRKRQRERPEKPNKRKQALESVTAGTDIKTILENRTTGSKFSHLPLAERLQAEQEEKKRIQKEIYIEQRRRAYLERREEINKRFGRHKEVDSRDTRGSGSLGSLIGHSTSSKFQGKFNGRGGRGGRGRGGRR